MIRRGDTLRWMYRGGRPNRVAAVLNRWSASLGSAGIWPGRLATLEVRGRRSGRLITLPVVTVTYEGERYLVAMLGECTSWVRNVRAAGGQAVLRHGGAESVRLDEVDPSVRPPILRRYLEVAPGGRPHIPVDRRAPLAEFEQVAARYPVFRIHRGAGGPTGPLIPRRRILRPLRGPAPAAHASGSRTEGASMSTADRSTSTAQTEATHSETTPIRGDVLVSKMKDLLHEGTVRRLIVKNDDGHTVMEIPVVAGVFAAVVAPVLTAVGAVAALANHWKIEVERTTGQPAE